MKTLYLMRHAKSSWKDPELYDHRRPLNKRGKRAVPIMAERLKKRSVHLDRIVSSDARRALDTALPVGRSLGLVDSAIQQEPQLYHASEEKILEMVRRLEDQWQEVMLVGHNPGLQDFANRFYAPPLPKLPTAGIVTLVFEIDSWREIHRRQLIYTHFDYPKKAT